MGSFVLRASCFAMETKFRHMRKLFVGVSYLADLDGDCFFMVKFCNFLSEEFIFFIHNCQQNNNLLHISLFTVAKMPAFYGLICEFGVYCS